MEVHGHEMRFATRDDTIGRVQVGSGTKHVMTRVLGVQGTKINRDESCSGHTTII